MTEDKIKEIVSQQIQQAIADQVSGLFKSDEKTEVTEIPKVEKAPIDVERLFEIWKTSELKKTDILLVKSDNEYVSFDYANEFKELFERLGFTPIIVTIRANDSFDIIPEVKLNEMGYFRKKED